MTKTYVKMQKAFPGGEIPATIVVRGDMTSPAMTEALGQLAWRAPLAGLMRDSVVDVNEERTVARISIPILGDGSDATSTAALRALREEIVPATIGSVADVE